MSALPLRARRLIERSRRALGGRSALPPGWRFGAPDFVGVGAELCGTSWWYGCLLGHPGVHREPGAPERLEFFSAFEPGRGARSDVGRYELLFPRPPGAITGEWSDRYLYDFWTPQLLAEAAPEARLLVLLRDPVERFRSALAAAPRRRWGRASAGEAFERGLYHAQLTRLLALFDRSRLLVLQYERCRDDPHGQLRRSYEFLGLDPGVAPTALLQPGNMAHAREVELPAYVVDSLRRGYARDVTLLFESFPQLDASLWTSLFGSGSLRRG